MELKNYRKKGVQPMYPWQKGYSLEGISVSEGDTPEVGGMIAVNPDDPSDQWYVSKAFFEANYEEAE